MALFDRYTPRRDYPLSRAQIRRFTSGNSAMHDFLSQYATRDAVVFFDDFLGDTINLDNYAVANSGGTSAADFALVAAVNGTIQGDTGTSDNGSISLIGPAIWKGDNNAGMEIRFKMDAVTDVHWEVGFINGVPGSNTGGINDIDTPTVYMTDGAVVGMDTDQTLKTMAFVTEGSTTGQDPTKTNLGTLAPAAATYMTVRIQLKGNHAAAWVNGTLYATHASDADGHVEGGTLLAPWVYVQTRSTTPKFFDVDYLRIWADRA